MFIKSASKSITAIHLYLRVIWVGLILFSFSLSGYSADDSIKIKILAVNPSSKYGLQTKVSQYLPPEVGPDDVIDKEGLEIKYDAEKKSYLVLKEVDLKPGETQTIELRVRNVWVISPEQIEEVKSQLKQSSDALAKTKFAPTGKMLFERASESITRIEESQLKSLGIMQKIDLYRMNIKMLEDLKQNALSLEAMRKLEGEKKSGIREVTFAINAENPSSEQKKLTVKGELPRDIKAEDVLDKGSFELVYNDKTSRFSLEQVDTLGPKEVKKYDVRIRDIWYIPQSELDFLTSEIEKLVPLFNKSPYEDFAAKQKDLVLKAIQAIVALQAEVESSSNFDDRIRAHVLNEQREKSAKRKIKELQDLLSEVSLKPVEDEGKGTFQQMIRKLIDIKNKVLAAFGNQPKKTIIWWFFLGIVLFLAVVTIIFYGTWLKKLQNNKWTSPAKTKPKSDGQETPSTEAKP